MSEIADLNEHSKAVASGNVEDFWWIVFDVLKEGRTYWYFVNGRYFGQSDELEVAVSAASNSTEFEWSRRGKD